VYSRKIITFLFACALTGAAVGFVLALAQLSGRLVHWKSLGAPPERPVRIVAASSRGVWVEAISGQLYVGSPQGRWGLSTGNFPLFNATASEIDIRVKPKPLKDATDIREAVEPVGAITIYSVYTIRNDGSVYLWQDWPKPEDRKLLLIAPMLGTFLFVIIPLFVITLYRWLEERKSSGLASEDILTLRRDYW
jgi:hypothetical protein